MVRAPLLALLAAFPLYAQLPCTQVDADVPRVVSSPGRLYTADFDGDGNADVLTAGEGVSILYGNGDGTFEPPAAVSAVFASQLRIADFDGDDLPDILTAENGALVLRANLGHRTFAAPRVIRQSPNEVLLAADDFTNDGAADILVAVTVSLSTHVTLVNDGEGHFTETTFQGYVSASPAVGDVDGDGNADLLSELVWGVTIMYGDGRGKFGARYAILTQPGNPFPVDLNGDGRDEIVALRTDPNEITVIDGSATRRFAATAAATTLVPGDYNDDGAIDVAVLAGRRVRVYLNDRAGGLVTSDALLGPPASSQFAAADINRDGALDLIIGAGSGFAISFGRGDGTFRFPRVKLLPDARLIGAADLDGDAVDELLVLRDARLYVSRGTAFDEVPVDVRATAALTGDFPVAAARDRLIAADGTFVRTFARDASASWREVASWDAGAPVKALTAVHSGEVALIADHALQIRRADGTLLSSAELPPTWNAAVHKADVDGDGHADLLVTGSGTWYFCSFPCGHSYAPLNDGYVLFFRARGDGTFDAASPLITKTQILDFTPGDFNGDRRSDFVLTTEAGEVSVFQSDGAGGYHRTSLGMHSPEAAHAAGDINGDGVDDLALSINDALTLFHGSTAGLVEGGTYVGTDIPYMARRGSRADVLYTLPFGDAGVIASECRIARRRIVRH